jgi:hypothetical protein
LAYLLIPANPTELSDVDSLEAVHDTPGQSETKKNEEARPNDASLEIEKKQESYNIPDIKCMQNRNKMLEMAE